MADCLVRGRLPRRPPHMPPRRKAAAAPAAAKEAPPSKKQKASAYDDDRLEVPVIGGSVVYIGHGLLTKIPAEITAKDSGIKASRFVVISDTNVFPIYGQKLIDAFEAAGHKAIAFQVAAGEGSKSRANKSAIEDFVLQHKCQRDTCFLALGGGVVGDLTGYVAATFMRGVPIVQIPTSMMAMVDSSVGGKTAINVPAGKNLIGSFHQPRRVYADLDLLHSLHAREIDEGLAEAIKVSSPPHTFNTHTHTRTHTHTHTHTHHTHAHIRTLRLCVFCNEAHLPPTLFSRVPAINNPARACY